MSNADTNTPVSRDSGETEEATNNGNDSSHCEICGSFRGLPVETIGHYNVPDEYDCLCRDCARQENTHTADQMTDGELIAAIMEDSIGYASPQHARKHVRRFRDGHQEAYCERATACFDNDMKELIESARRRWCNASREKKEKLREFAEKWDEIDDPGKSMTISAMAPLALP